jgi:hypothetical protein
METSSIGIRRRGRHGQPTDANPLSSIRCRRSGAVDPLDPVPSIRSRRSVGSVPLDPVPSIRSRRSVVVDPVSDTLQVFALQVGIRQTCSDQNLQRV